MKKFYMTMAALLCGVAAMAQNYLYAENIVAEAAGTEVGLEVALKNEVEVTAISFRLALPEGVTMALNKKGKKYVTIDEDRMEDHTSIIQDAADGNDMITVYDAGKAPFYGNDGTVVTVPLAIAESVALGVYDIKIYNVSISTPNSESVATETEWTCKLDVGGVGINNIKALDSKAPIYNVIGQRVNKAQKGVFIQKGKKVAVK
jgi:hypothetical protein